MNKDKVIKEKNKIRGTVSDPQIPIKRKIWRILVPVLIYDGALWLVTLIAGSVLPNLFPDQAVSDLLYQTSVLCTLIAGLAAFPFLWREYKKDEGMFEPADHTGKTPWTWPEIALSVLGVMSIGHLLNLLMQVTGFLTLFGDYSSTSESIYEGQNVFLLILTIGIVSAVCEEFAFRVILYRRARDFWGILPAALISAGLFGLYHGNLVQGIYGFLISLLIIADYEASGNLMVPVLAHIASNIWSLFRSPILSGLTAQYAYAPVILYTVEGIIAVLALTFLYRTRFRSRS